MRPLLSLQVSLDGKPTLNLSSFSNGIYRVRIHRHTPGMVTVNRFIHNHPDFIFIYAILFQF
jgi:hypothetical protein